MIDLKNRVKELRKERNLKQDELANKINVSQQTISRIENGDNSLPADTLIDLAEFFDVSIDYILYLTDSRRTVESQIEFHKIMERNYNLCRIFEHLDPQNQDLLFKLAEQLEKTGN